jgi:hypothetical protein
MAEHKKPFGELVNDAPLATQEDTVTLVGALARSNQQGKFVLTLSQGNSVTLDVDAVKNYTVMGGAVGQMLVQVEVDRARLPENLQGNAPQLNSFPAYELKAPFADRTTPLADIFTLPVVDQTTRWYLDEVFKNPAVDYGGKGIIEGLPGDPGDPYAGGAPFALATAHQAPESALAGPQGGIRTAPALDYTLAWRDKHPWLDITGRPPYPD